MKKLLIIGYVWPEPASSAAGYHMLSFIQLFKKKGFQVTFASPAALSEHRADLAALEVDEVCIELNSSSFDDWVKALAPDVVLFDRFMMEEQFGWRVEQQCPNALRLLDTEDLHSLRDTRQQWIKEQLNQKTLDLAPLTQTEPLYARMAINDLTQREIAAIYRCDLTLMISDFELDLLTNAFAVPPQQLIHCPFMLEEKVSPSLNFAERQHFVSIGNFRHAPNWDAVLWLKQLWPQIRKQLPKAELHIYGAYPPPKATALHNAKEGFLVKGWAKDAHEVIASARVLLAPLRFGAGIKGKLLDAMRNGTPSVTTSIGIEGMCHNPDHWAGTVADQETDFIQAAVQLYHEQTHWIDAQQQGFSLLAARFDKNAIESAVWARIAPLLDAERLSAHRRANFTGLMLRHHHHKSTQYMSQWIEAKNRLTKTLES